MSNFQKYHEAVDFLEGLNNLPIQGDYMIDTHHADIYLKRMRYFLELLGNPDKKIKFIHVAGTSGKGTVTNMLHEILFAADKKVGSFTSPSVITSIEKMKVNEKYIGPEEFANIVDYLKPFIDKAYKDGPYGRPSHFELLLATALIYFHRQKCEWVVLEVGLGGRFDATNIIENPTVTAITTIDYDHTELLGKTLKKIAYDKAGIIKPNSIFFTTEQRPTLIKLFKEICAQKKASFHQLPQQENYNIYNKALVTAIAKHIGIEEKHIHHGIKKARLMCRFEIMQDKPIAIIDGAHNPSKIKSTIENLKNIQFRKLFLIVAIADNKDHLSILQQIIPQADYIFFTKFQNRERKCAHPKELWEISKKYLKREAKTEILLDSGQALNEVFKLAKDEDAILIVGSFYLAGELRRQWVSEEYILKHRNGFKKIAEECLIPYTRRIAARIITTCEKMPINK